MVTLPATGSVALIGGPAVEPATRLEPDQAGVGGPGVGRDQGVPELVDADAGPGEHPDAGDHDAAVRRRRRLLHGPK